MTPVATKSEMQLRLTEIAAAQGLSVTPRGQDTFRGERIAIQSKWILGVHKVKQRISCRLSEAERTATFREAVFETTWGFPPPAVVVDTSIVTGRTRSGVLKETSRYGGGELDYAAVREALQQAAVSGGWLFVVEVGLP
jgi:hypothetical protein